MVAAIYENLHNIWIKYKWRIPTFLYDGGGGICVSKFWPKVMRLLEPEDFDKIQIFFSIAQFGMFWRIFLKSYLFFIL